MNSNFGRKPDYLVDFDRQRQLERQRQEYLNYLLDTIPKGKRLVQEDERHKVLASLQAEKVQIVQAMERFPIQRANVKRSQFMERKMDDLIQRLSRAENLIRLYSEPPVFVDANLPEGQIAEIS